MWFRTDDALPENESYALVYWIAEHGVNCYSIAQFVGREWWFRGVILQPTHWMRLKPPEKE